jgi:hypothetical protein
MLTSGGSRLTELNALTVIPTSRFRAPSAVTTVTPVANLPSTERNECWSTLISRWVKEIEKIPRSQNFTSGYEIADHSDEEIGHVPATR